MKALQTFTEEQLAYGRNMTPDQIVRFLEDFRTLHATRPAPGKLISMKVPTDLLAAFRAKAALTGIPYQTQIKRLMRAWILDGDLS